MVALKINESFDMDELISENKFCYLRLLIFVCVKIVVNSFIRAPIYSRMVFTIAKKRVKGKFRIRKATPNNSIRTHKSDVLFLIIKRGL